MAHFGLQIGQQSRAAPADRITTLAGRPKCLSSCRGSSVTTATTVGCSSKQQQQQLDCSTGLVGSTRFGQLAGTRLVPGLPCAAVCSQCFPAAMQHYRLQVQWGPGCSADRCCTPFWCGLLRESPGDVFQVSQSNRQQVFSSVMAGDTPCRAILPWPLCCCSARAFASLAGCTSQLNAAKTFLQQWPEAVLLQQLGLCF